MVASAPGTTPSEGMTIAEMTAAIGGEAVSDWLLIDQATIDAFADATGDRQFIHVDPAAAAATPFGGTIAHGFLTLSLMPQLASMTPDLPRLGGAAVAINYGGDRVRFVAPVRAGRRVRARFRLLAFDPQGQGQYQQRMGYTVEIEGEERPALVAEWLTRIVGPVPSPG